LLIKRKPLQGFADIEMDEKAVEARMADYLRHIPMAAKRMQVRMQDGVPNPQDISVTAKDRLFVRIALR